MHQAHGILGARQTLILTRPIEPYDSQTGLDAVQVTDILALSMPLPVLEVLLVAFEPHRYGLSDRRSLDSAGWSDGSQAFCLSPAVLVGAQRGTGQYIGAA